MATNHECMNALSLAIKHSGDNASAKICIQDALLMISLERYKDAMRRIYNSLQHSVGIFHPDCQAVSKLRF